MNSRARTSLLSPVMVVTVTSLALFLGGCLDRKLKALNPCLVSGVVAKISVTNIDKIDMLFMVDNSGSMKEEQVALRTQFPNLINVLTTGDVDRDGNNDFPPAKNMHLGVVSSDLGLVGVTGIEKCLDLGDDGVMQNVASPEVMGCSPTGYPRFLTYTAGTNTPMQTATDFSCIASLGTDGCGFEQQLESALKAVWPADDTRVSFLPNPMGFGATGQGDNGGMNAGFLRNDPVVGLSLIAIVFVTDEEDCSAKNTSHNRPPAYLDPANPVDAELLKQGLNTRCNFAVNNLYDKERYINGFKALRPGNEQLVIVAAIAGVPVETVEQIPEDFADNPASQAAFYAGIRGHALMTPMVDTLGTPSPDDDVMRPSCDVQNVGRAYPPNRIVDVVEGFGGNGIVQSICQADFGPAIDAIIAIIARQLGAVCLPRPLVRDASGKVGCNVVWELPLAGRAPTGTPVTCAESAFLLPVEEGEDTQTDNGAARCRVAQLAAVGGALMMPTETDGIPFNDGWYYDDFSDEVMTECTTSPKQRIAFTSGAMPPTGVTVQLECLNETQSLADNRPDIDQNVEQPTIGDPCQEVMRNGMTLEGNAACAVRLADGSQDTDLFCHGELNVCVLDCTTDADCPAAWVCDTREQVADKSGGMHYYCVNPTCGT